MVKKNWHCTNNRGDWLPNKPFLSVSRLLIPNQGFLSHLRFREKRIDEDIRQRNSIFLLDDISWTHSRRIVPRYNNHWGVKHIEDFSTCNFIISMDPSQLQLRRMVAFPMNNRRLDLDVANCLNQIAWSFLFQLLQKLSQISHR